MAGFCGVLGGDRLPEAMAAWTRWRDTETAFSYADEHVDLALSCHPIQGGDQPATGDGGDVAVWVWGDVYGHGSGAAYEPRPGDPDESAAYCARLYREHGMGFVEELNGQFALAVHDREERTFSLVTDRLASLPLYAADLDGGYVFSSNLQSLPHHPDVPLAFDREFLQEYLALRRVFGVETPLEGVRKVPPATVVTVDLLEGSTDRTSYWRPTYEPADRPFSHFVDRLAETMTDLFTEWTRDDLDYGVLLSGGSDSRLVQAAIDQPVVAFHNADWKSREARIAEQVAELGGDEFRLLRRYEDHEARSLETAPALSNFSGWFDQAYFTEFEAEIADEVDVLVSGLFADMLFAGGPLDTRSVSLGSVGTLSLPIREPVRDVDDYVDLQLAEAQPIPYFDADRPLREVVRSNVERTEEGIVSHGLTYDSLTDLVMYGDYYPLGADTEAIFPQSLLQICPYRTPFLDNRVFEIHRRMPMRYLLRRNVIHAVIDRLAPTLAKVPHARTGVSLQRSFPVEFIGTNLYGFHRKHIREDPTPEPYMDHKPWPNRRELLRADTFAADTIRENEDLVRSLPFLDYEAAEQTYRAHLEDADNTTVIYSLLTLLEMPLTEAAVGGADRAAPRPPRAVATSLDGGTDAAADAGAGLDHDRGADSARDGDSRHDAGDPSEGEL
ncbi:MAG: asparagine synthase-related protein [Haloferacaceae archaeon]